MAKDAEIRKQQRRIAALKKHKKALQKKCAELEGILPRQTQQCRSLDSLFNVQVDAGDSAAGCLSMALPCKDLSVLDWRSVC
jgi:hypothetical protein